MLKWVRRINSYLNRAALTAEDGLLIITIYKGDGMNQVSRSMATVRVISTLICFLALSVSVSAKKVDMEGSRDHPKVPRIDGTYIVGYAQTPFDEGTFITGMEHRKLQTNVLEGPRTRLVYLGPKSISSLSVMRNYQTALAELGEIKEVFSCSKHDCYRNFPEAFIWAKQNRVENVLTDSGYTFNHHKFYRDQRYWYGTVTSATARYHVSVYSTVFAADNRAESLRGHPFIYLEILEEADFTPTLAMVTPEEITKSMIEKGHIALYGIHFDVDSAVLKSESKSTLAAIATVLSNDPALSMYVVGHPDNQGTYDHNLDLSQQRAASVVEALTGEHGIAAKRLKALGVGPAAPVASHASEEGQAMNRRVELVAF